MNNIIDYDDMISNGLIKEAVVDNTPIKEAGDSKRKFAILLKAASGKLIPKFDITTKLAVQNAITAINENALPKEISDPAKYYIKEAATHFDIPLNWKTEKHARTIDANVLSKEIKTITQYRIKIGQSTFSLSTPIQLKLAEEYFLGRLHNMPIGSRQRIACTIIKEAVNQRFTPSDITKIWAHPVLGNKVASEIDFRKKIKPDDEEYINILNKYASVANHVKPVTFIEVIRKADKIAGFYPHNYGRDYSAFTHNTPRRDFTSDFDAIVKKAMLSSNPEFIDLVY